MKKMNKLVKDGVTSVAEIERHLGFCVKEELYDGLPLPDPGNHRFSQVVMTYLTSCTRPLYR